MQNTLRWMQQHSPREIMEKMPESFRGDDPSVYLEALQRLAHPDWTPYW